jgi:hypothetical protein
MSRIDLCLLTVLMAFTVAAAAEVRPCDKDSAQCDKPKMNRIKYRVARSERTVVGPSTLVLYVSINSRHFNRDDMVVLASQLNRDLWKEPRVTVLIFSDYRAAKSLVFSIEHPPTYDRDKAALRGGYNVDRVAHTESVSFSPDPSKPRDEIRINLNP